ncbi:hypothetical protein EDD85DRAFT_845180 [Armillaria nabsnona]|nr:hypothetical protein EDD85DRAFT_845180 [Armillaria nabsnona]
MMFALFGASLVSAAVLPQIDARADLPSPECVAAIKSIGLFGCWGRIWQAKPFICGAKQAVLQLRPVKTSRLVQLAQCYNSEVSDASDISHLSYNIYAKIVGDCAWQEGGCPITFQNYVDWFYGALSAVNATIWPEFAGVEANWGYILDWTLTGDTLPYTNFDDWLHYSNS